MTRQMVPVKNSVEGKVVCLVYVIRGGSVVFVRVSEDDVPRAKEFGRACGTPVVAVVRTKT